MRAFWVPEVLLLVGAEDLALVGDEIRDVQEFGASLFDDGAGDEADVAFFGEGAVRVDIFLVLGAEDGELGVIGEPVG